MERDVFVSYSSSDVRIAVAVTDHLRANLDMRPWLDVDEIVPGRPWRPQILEGLESCRLVLLIGSQYAVASNEVAAECTAARELGLPVVCCTIDDY